LLHLKTIPIKLIFGLYFIFIKTEMRKITNFTLHLLFDMFYLIVDQLKAISKIHDFVIISDNKIYLFTPPPDIFIDKNNF
jgi:hypothetical protein